MTLFFSLDSFACLSALFEDPTPLYSVDNYPKITKIKASFEAFELASERLKLKVEYSEGSIIITHMPGYIHSAIKGEIHFQLQSWMDAFDLPLAVMMKSPVSIEAGAKVPDVFVAHLEAVFPCFFVEVEVSVAQRIDEAKCKCEKYSESGAKYVMVVDFEKEVKDNPLSIHFSDESGEWFKLPLNHDNLIIPGHVFGVDKDFSLNVLEMKRKAEVAHVMRQRLHAS